MSEDESLRERATRLKRDQDLGGARERFATSSEGLKSADNAYGELVEAIKSGAAEISGADIACKVEERNERCTVVKGKGVVLVTQWELLSSLDNAKLFVDFYDGVPRDVPGGGLPGTHAKSLDAMEFTYGLSEPDRPSWSGKYGNISSGDLAKKLLLRFMDLQPQ